MSNAGIANRRNLVPTTPAITTTDASVQCGLLWDDHIEPVELLEAGGLANSATARRLQVLFAAHADAAQPAVHRLAAYCALTRLVLSRLGEPIDVDGRARRTVLLVALEGAELAARGPHSFDQLLRLQAQIEERWRDWCDYPELVVASELLEAPVSGRTRDARHHGLGAWSRSAQLLRALAGLVAPDELEPLMQQAAELSYRHLFAASAAPSA